MEKDSSRRSSGVHSTHNVLVPGQRTRQQPQQGVNYGHCITHRRISDESPQAIMEQRRQQQSYDNPQSRLHPQQMMYDHSQSHMMPGPHPPIYPTSLSQADYNMMMMSHRGTAAGMGGDYFMPIREKPPEQHQEWIMGGGMPAQSQPTTSTRKLSRKDIENSQSDISNFMEDPGSPGTLNGDFNSQTVPPYYPHLSQELDMELSDIPSVSTPIDDTISQKVGYGGSMVDMTQTSNEYSRRKSGDLASTQVPMGNMDGHMSRSVHTMPNEGRSYKSGDSGGHRKPVVRTHSISQQRSTPGPHTNMKKMGSEPQLNNFGPPGLQSSILPRLAAPVELVRPNSSSTLPRNSGSRTNKPSHNSPPSSHSNQMKGNNSTSPPRQPSHHHGQRFKQQTQKVGGNRGGVVSLTQPNPPPSTGSSTEDERKSIPMTQTEHDTSPASSTINNPSTSSSSPVQHQLQQQSPSNQLRSSGRSTGRSSGRYVI